MNVLFVIGVLIVLCFIFLLCWRNVERQYQCAENGLSILVHNRILNKQIVTSAKVRQLINFDNALRESLNVLYSLTLRNARSSLDSKEEVFVGFIDSLQHDVEIRRIAGEVAVGLAIDFIKNQYKQYCEFMIMDHREISNINFMDNILSDYEVVYKEYLHDTSYDLST